MWLSALGLAASLFGATVAAAGLAAFTASNRTRLRYLADEGIAPARRLLPLAERPGPTAAALASADVLLGVAALLCAFALVRAPEMPGDVEAVVVALAAALLLVGHMVAWAVAVARPEGVGLALAPLTQALALLFLPFAALVASRFAVSRPAGVVRGANGEGGPSELQKFVDVVDENSALEAGEQKMIHGIVELGERTVREVMVPRIDMIAVSRDARVADVLERIHASGHSRIPVYGDGIDDIVGILYAKDLLHQMGAVALDAPIGPLIRPAHFVPETKRVDDLLHEMQDMKVHIAIVVDEYGGTAGLITIEDLLEEIVGEIRDEYDILEETWIEPVNEREAIFNARVSIHDVNQTLPLNLDDAEYDTLGGLVYASLGKVPAQGDEVRVDNAVVSVLSTAGRRIRKVRVTVEPPPPNGKDG
jgi:CBS domain containing-hemolysin-like protein